MSKLLLVIGAAAILAAQQSDTAEGFVARMMAFDANHDGRLTRSEVTDPRLLRLFDRADANHDGVVTRDELLALYKQEAPGPGEGPGPGRGPGMGPGMGPGDMRPQPGQILPAGAQRMLNLTSEQQTALAKLQREVDAKLAALLTDEQKARLKEMSQRGPGGPPPDRANGPGFPRP